MAQKETLDFSQVRDAGNFNPKRKTEGEYLGTIVSFEDTKSKSGNKMWVYGIQLKSDRRAVYPVYCVLDVKSLWKLRDVLMACGVKVPKKKLNVDGNRLVGKDVGIFLEDDEYEGKPKSVITSFFPASEYEGADADGSADDEGEDDEVEEEEEYEDEAPADEDDEDSADDSDDEDDTDEDDEEDEEPPAKPAKKAPAKRSAPARAKTKKAAPADDEDEDEMDVEDL